MIGISTMLQGWSSSAARPLEKRRIVIRNDPSLGEEVEENWKQHLELSWLSPFSNKELNLVRFSKMIMICRWKGPIEPKKQGDLLYLSVVANFILLHPLDWYRNLDRSAWLLAADLLAPSLCSRSEQLFCWNRNSENKELVKDEKERISLGNFGRTVSFPSQRGTPGLGKQGCRGHGGHGGVDNQR